MYTDVKQKQKCSTCQALLNSRVTQIQMGKAESKKQSFNPKRKSVSWRVFLFKKVRRIGKESKDLNSYQVAISFTTEWIICQYGFVDISVEIALALSDPLGTPC